MNPEHDLMGLLLVSLATGWSWAVTTCIYRMDEQHPPWRVAKVEPQVVVVVGSIHRRYRSPDLGGPLT